MSKTRCCSSPSRTKNSRVSWTRFGRFLEGESERGEVSVESDHDLKGQRTSLRTTTPSDVTSPVSTNLLKNSSFLERIQSRRIVRICMEEGRLTVSKSCVLGVSRERHVNSRSRRQGVRRARASKSSVPNEETRTRPTMEVREENVEL